MRVTCDAFALPKAGSSPDEYEDASRMQADRSGRGGISRYAVADGASETSYARLWAELLVEGYAGGGLTERCGGRRRAEQIGEEALACLRAEWLMQVGARPRPWYAAEKLQLGAYAALLGLRLSQSRTRRRWTALAAGDSCLFHVRNRHLIAAFPYRRTADFNNRPLLIGSNRDGAPVRACFRYCRGSWHVGDLFFLMTDALACWFLHMVEIGGYPWDTIRDLGTPHAFGGWIEGLRAAGALRNDDVTLLRVDSSRAECDDVRQERDR